MCKSRDFCEEEEDEKKGSVGTTGERQRVGMFDSVIGREPERAIGF